MSSPCLGSRHRDVNRVRQGHAQVHKHHKRELRFFAIKIEEHFEFRTDWYRSGEVRDLALEYYFVLRSVLRTHPELRQYRTRCRHCRIFFITDPRNVGRSDLRCPFGCREAHRKQCSTQRSVSYYQDDCGKIKKKIQNRKRKSRVIEPDEEDVVGNVVEDEFDRVVVEHVRMVTSLIEGRPVSRNEILRMLSKVMRQHSMGRRSRLDYIVLELNKHPP